jgi:hypothetical protein
MEDSFIRLKVALRCYKIVEKKFKGEKMGLKISKRGQGATEYLLMLAAVLVIVAVAIYYVTRAGGYPVVSMNAEAVGDTIRLDVLSGSIAAGQWQWSVSTSANNYTWHDTDTLGALAAPSVELENSLPAGNYYVNVKHKTTGHIYFSSDQVLTVASS